MSELKIIVCLKQVPDPEGPSASFKIDAAMKKIIPIGIPPVINPFDENALEAALRLRDVHSVKIVALSLGGKLAKPVLRKALGVGADELLLLEDDRLQDIDSYSTAYVLSTAIKKIGAYDLILTGRQASDWNSGETGPILAELLQIPCITLVQGIKVENGKVVVQRLKRNGYEMVRASMPALLTVTNEIGNLRSASLKAIKEAFNKPVTVWGISALEVEPQRLRTRTIYALSAPERERKCTFIDGQSFQEKGEKLALRLREDGII